MIVGSDFPQETGTTTHIVYGSAALGYLRDASDIDILRIVDTRPAGHTPQRLTARLGPHPVSLYTITQSDLDRDASSGEYGGYYALKLLNPVCASSRHVLGTLSTPLQFLSGVETLGPQILHTEDPRSAVQLMIEAAIQLYPAFAASLALISRDEKAWSRYWEVQESRLVRARRTPIVPSERPFTPSELRQRFFQHGADMHAYGDEFRQIYESKASDSVTDDVLSQLR